MTGFGQASADLPGARVTVEARSVNNRFADLRLRLPGAWSELEPWTGRVSAWCWNFISGSEVERETFEKVKLHSAGPLHLDVHNLCFGPPREGDVRDSQADPAKAVRLLGFTPEISLTDGLTQAIAWFRTTTVR